MKFYSNCFPNPKAPCTRQVFAANSAPAGSALSAVSPFSTDRRKAAAKESPAPSVSTAFTSFGG